MNRMLKHTIEESRKTMIEAMEKILKKSLESWAMYHSAQLLEKGDTATTYYRSRAEAYESAAHILREQIRELDSLKPWEELPF